MSIYKSKDTRWWRESKGDCHNAVFSITRGIQQDQSGRLANLTAAARLFGDSPLLGLSPGSISQTSSPSSFGRLSLNIVRALATTARADLVDGPAPAAWFVTSGGDYSLQRSAQGMTKFVEGVFYYNDFDAQERLACLHSVVFGDGISKFYDEWGKVKIERAYPWELFVDDRDAYYGSPRSLYQIRWVDRTVLAERYPSKSGEIETATSSDLDSAIGLSRDWKLDQCLVIEAWRLPSGPEADDGRHVIVTSNATLLDEEWEDNTFPFARLSWSEPLTGYFADGIAMELKNLQYEINFCIEKIRKALHLCSNPRILVDKASGVETAHINNEIGSVIKYRGRPPIFDIARAVSPELLQHLESLYQRAYELTGVSQMQATSMRPAGVNSGKAMQVHAQLQSKRFVAWGKARLGYRIQAAKQVCRVQRRIGKENPRATIVYVDTRRRNREPIVWDEVALDESAYEVMAYPVSSLPNDPVGRIDTLDAWVNAGWMDRAGAMRLLNMPDIEAETNLETAPRELLEQAIERMLGEGVPFYPEPFYDLALCHRIASLHYMRGRIQGVPEENLELLRRFIVATEKMAEKAAKASAPPQPPPPPGPEALPPQQLPPPEAMPGVAA